MLHTLSYCRAVPSLIILEKSPVLVSSYETEEDHKHPALFKSSCEWRCVRAPISIAILTTCEACTSLSCHTTSLRGIVRRLSRLMSYWSISNNAMGYSVRLTDLRLQHTGIPKQLLHRFPWYIALALYPALLYVQDI